MQDRNLSQHDYGPVTGKRGPTAPTTVGAEAQPAGGGHFAVHASRHIGHSPRTVEVAGGHAPCSIQNVAIQNVAIQNVATKNVAIQNALSSGTRRALRPRGAVNSCVLDKGHRRDRGDCGDPNPQAC